MQCQYPYADTTQIDSRIVRFPDAHRNHLNPMTTPDDTTDTTRTPTDQTSTTQDGRTLGTSNATRRPNAATPQIPGRIPATEEAGAPLVPQTRSTARPTIERDAPLVPDLRPTRRPRADGGAQ